MLKINDEEYKINVNELTKNRDLNKFKYMGNVEHFINIDKYERTRESLSDEEIVKIVLDKEDKTEDLNDVNDVSPKKYLLSD